MASEKQNNSFVTKLLGWLVEERQYLQLRITAIDQKLAELENCQLLAQANQLIKDVQRTEQVADFKKSLESGHQKIDDEDYDLILSLPDQSLRFRMDPASHSPLISTDFDGIGPQRMQILIYMLENPGTSFHAGNISKAYPPRLYSNKPDALSVGTFAKTISDFRKILRQTRTKGPYLVTTFDWDGVTQLKKGAVYMINPQWKYLVIRQKEF